MDLDSASISSVGLLCRSLPAGACSVSGLRVSNTRSLWLSVRKSRKSRLRLNVNAQQRTARRRFRTEIAHETIFGPNLDVTGGAVGIVNENGANRRLIRIVHRQLFETEIIDQFLTGFFGVGGRRTGPNHPRRQKRLFHVMPALLTRMGVSAFLSNRSRTH